MDDAFSFEIAHARSIDRQMYLVAKRVTDLAAASLTLVLLLPLLLVIALAIKLDGPGPVLYVQKRVKGRSQPGRLSSVDPVPFDFFKFRTMTVGNEGRHREYIAAYIAGSEEAMETVNGGTKASNSYKLAHDPAVTRVGRFLRQWSLDELPQLINVIKGDMSLVGPRPPITYEIAHYAEHHLQRLAVPGGITGLWQTSGRAALTFEAMVALDLEYIETRTFLGDVWILLKTVPTVLSREGAG